MESHSCDVDASAAAEPSLCVNYDESEFWETIPIGVCVAAPTNFVLVATRNLCHMLLVREHKYVVMKLAAKLATQVRSFENLHQLLVNQDVLRTVFDVRRDVRLDLNGIVVQGAEYSAHVDYDDDQQLSDFLYFVDSLTATQALAFGPWFACLIVKLSKNDVVTVASDINTLMKRLVAKGWFDKCIVYPVLEKECLVGLLSAYAGTAPTKILFNSVFAGLIYAYHKTVMADECGRELAFLVFGSMSCHGMDVLTLVQAFRVASGVSVDEYRRLMLQSVESPELVRESFAGLVDFDDRHWPKEVAPRTQRWMYASVFDDRVLAELSYERHPWLCNFTAHLVDRFVKEGVVKLAPLYRRWYQNYANVRLTSCAKGALSKADVEAADSVFSRCLEQRNIYFVKSKDGAKVAVQYISDDEARPSKRLKRG